MSTKIPVEEYTVPEAGTDVTEITIEEQYAVEGVGDDTVVLTGTLVSDRDGAPAG